MSDDFAGPRQCLRLLDGFTLEADGTRVSVVPGVRKLLALLALRDTPADRRTVAGLLWPDTTARRAAACLRSTLWRVAQPGVRLVLTREDQLVLAPTVEVDFRRAARLAADVASDRAQPDERAVAVLKADLLPGWEHPWVLDEQDWWRQARLRGLEALSERFRLGGDHLHAHQAALAAVHSDPLRESAQRTLVELHLADGNPVAALRQYTRYRTQLRGELGLSPSPRLQRLVQPLLGGCG